MSGTAPANPAAEVWPTWVDFVDNWRATDAHWFRARVVNMFDDTTARTNANMGTPLIGALSFLQASTTAAPTGSLEFYNNSGAWESVRYPNLSVASATGPPATVTMRQIAAGSGIVLQSDGVAAIEKLNAGLGVLNVISTGATIKTGTKAVLLTTDTAALVIDSPVKITGTLTATGALSAPSLALTGALTAATVTATGQVQGATTVATGQASGATGLFGGNALVGANTTNASFRHNAMAAGGGFQADSAGNVSVTALGSGQVSLSGVVNASSTVNVTGALNATAGGVLGAAGYGVVLAGLVVVNRAPTGTDTHPNGTIWIQT